MCEQEPLFPRACIPHQKVYSGTHSPAPEREGDGDVPVPFKLPFHPAPPPALPQLLPALLICIPSLIKVLFPESKKQK